ncbi:Multidrug export protein AcrF [Polaribacter huanghezhanensis]|uniref:efflux RND transporter permease subunit n=1 Tax=Polaribacter huanghezhanensis TaxID=1354726 RepID=UPI0026479F6D|nr:efflux RND transporter permease subunit [Polaribacter huanghezhanensis]WKD85232.1 Multidrug export protein AcrF [Polaribacter huanghezhanensis]
MNKKLSSFSVLTIFVCLTIVGISLIPSLSIQLKPNRPSKSLSVNFTWSKASSKVIEQEVTSKLEGLFNSVRGIKEITSTSNKGNGNINLTFKKDIDIDIARFEIANIIRQNYQKFPDGVSFPQLSMNEGSENQSPILSYTINANESPYFIKKYAENHILSKLSKIEGVNQISLYGSAPFEWVITYSSDKLFQYNISILEVTNAINTYLDKKELGKGILKQEKDAAEKEIPMQYVYKSTNVFSWEEIPIQKIGNRVLFLKDIAKIRFKEGKVNAYYRINGLNTLNFAIYPSKGVNTIRLSKQVKQNIEELQKEISKGYYIKLTKDSSEFLVTELNKIKKRAFLSLLVLLILTIIVYRNFKYLFVLFTSILVNLLIAIIFYVALGVELQLYSLAGITISFGIIIDNCIIMMDHLLTKKNRKAFLAILAATLTTIGSVLVIFLLEESQRINLWDFAIVIAINIGVSLAVSFYFVPALLEKLNLKEKQKRPSLKKGKIIINFTKRYTSLISFCKKPIVKWGFILLFILGFGLPFHLSPEEIENPNELGKIYNKTLGSGWFTDEVKPTLEKITGGALRLFTDNVFENSYYAEPERTSLTVRGVMPEGSTIEQLNEVVQKMEQYISSFDEVNLFETSITSYRNSVIQIYFKEAYEFGSFPHTLKSLLETKAISLGGLDWFISGVGRGFSNALGTGGFGDQITLEGYNYDQLYTYAEQLKKNILKEANDRVKKVEISSDRWGRSSLFEYYLDFNSELLSLANISQSALYSMLENKLHIGEIKSIVADDELQKVKIVSDKYLNFNVWDLKHTPLVVNGNQYKLNELASIEKRKTGNTIKKRNQQYSLTVAYNFIGSSPLARKFKENRELEFKKSLPIGYRIYNPSYLDRWNKKDKAQYYYIFVIIGIIFFICAILLESLRQPFAIISMIPISFIGVFLTFYFFDINFDQGGYASFILLSGISVNSALYIINDFNNIKKGHPLLSVQKCYFKAFNSKITPIMLTIITTIVGLIPFVWEGQKEVFWFSFAAGSIGGLLFSIVGILLYLPLFIKMSTKTIL